jgi:predicted nucleotidyltransferase
MSGYMTKDNIALYEDTIKPLNMVMSAVGGSKLLGTNSLNSDNDVTGIFIEPMHQVAGFSSMDTIIVRSAALRECKHDAKSIAGDVDITLFGLRKYLQLAMVGNPNVISLLFSTGNQIVTDSALGAELRSLAPKIVSKRTLKAIAAWANNEMKKCNKTDFTEPVVRKRIAHVYILSRIGHQLASQQHITYPVAPDVIEIYRNIVSKAFSAYDTEDHVYRYLRAIDAYLDGTKVTALPDAPDSAAIEKWMLSIYTKTWLEALNKAA